MPKHEPPLPRRNKPQKRKTFLTHGIVLTLLLLLCASTVLNQIRPTRASNTIIVPDQYDTIQEAINHAQANDIIQVNPPPEPQEAYYEHVIVSKALTILGNLAHPENIIVDGSASGRVFEINATNVRIAGLTIRNAGNSNPAIVSEHDAIEARSDYSTIENNIITTNAYGIYFCYSHNNKVYNNIFINNPFDAIFLTFADNTEIAGNIITDSAYGIQSLSSHNTQITGNTINQTTWGIYLSSSSTGNLIRNNKITGKTIGIYSNSDSTTVDHNTVTDSAYAIYLQNNKLSPVTYNSIRGNSFGIRIYWSSTASSSHTIRNNLIQGNEYGLLLQYVNNNFFKGNWIQENTWGAYLEFAGSATTPNIFTCNNFVNNSMQAAAGTSPNQWSQGGIGNHWSDHTTPDANNDGIVDTPYALPPGADSFPLRYSWSEHDVEIQSVTASANQAPQGTLVDITVAVRNRANTSVSETFTITAYYSTTPIETLTVSWEHIYRDIDSNNKVSVGDIRLNPVGTYPAGSTVSSGHTDIDQSLVAFASNEKHLNNIASNSLYDPGEYIYRDIDSSGKVSVNDVRLTAVGSYLAGSVVATGDSDITSQNLIAFASNEKHTENVIANNLYEPGLNTGKTITLTFRWNTGGVPGGSYAIGAEVSSVNDELNTANNNHLDGTVEITVLVGDINMDGTVNANDLTLLMQAYGSADPQADLNKDNIVNTQDLYLLGKNYGRAN